MNSKCVIEMNFEVGGAARIAHHAAQFLVKICSFYSAAAYIMNCGTAVGLSIFSVQIHLAR